MDKTISVTSNEDAETQEVQRGEPIMITPSPFLNRDGVIVIQFKLHNLILS